MEQSTSFNGIFNWIRTFILDIPFSYLIDSFRELRMNCIRKIIPQKKLACNIDMKLVGKLPVDRSSAYVGVE